MPRKRRQVSKTGVYHIFVRGINREFIFNQVREKNYFKRILRKYLKKYRVEVYAYCIMSNHAHLLIKSEQLLELSMFMSKVLAEYATYYNYKKDRNGHVFQNRFSSEVIEDSNYFWNCLRYIHMNPVKAKMVSDVSKYKYSSICEYKNKSTNIVHENAIQRYTNKFETWEQWMEFHGYYGEGVFLDMEDEQENRYIEIAWNILWEMQENENVGNLIEIFEEPELREKYVDNMREGLKLSGPKIKKIYKKMERELFEKRK